MIAEQLRKSILQAAIQGQLTQQLPDDTNVQGMLNRIQEIKKKQTTNEKESETSENQAILVEDIPFEIPEAWKWVRLCEISKKILAGGDKPTSFSLNKTYENQIPVIANGEKNEGIVGYTNKTHICESSITISARGTIGYSKVRDFPFFPIVRLLIVVPMEIVDLKYLQYVFEALFETGVGTSIQQLTIPMISTKLVPLPPASEQKRIVDKIESFLPMIECLQNQEEKLFELQQQFPNQMKKAILQHAICGKLTEQLAEEGDARMLVEEIQRNKIQQARGSKVRKGPLLSDEISIEDIPFDIPENWCWIRFGSLVNFQMGKTPPRENAVYWGKGVPWVSISDMCEQETITETKEQVTQKAINDVFSNRISPKGTLIMSFKLTVGRTSFLGCDATHNEAIISIFPYAHSFVTSKYLARVLPILAITGKTKDAIKGKTLNSASLSELLIPLPPVAEQNRIVEALDAILPLIDSTDLKNPTRRVTKS
jgi:type I restriction enzyme, S subunit